jgi:hypothetical protein
MRVAVVQCSVGVGSWNPGQEVIFLCSGPGVRVEVFRRHSSHKDVGCVQVGPRYGVSMVKRPGALGLSGDLEL